MFRDSHAYGDISGERRIGFETLVVVSLEKVTGVTFLADDTALSIRATSG